MTPDMLSAYIGVGSNIRPETNIPAALNLLRRRVRVTGTSTFYRTPAVDRPDQPDYRNGVWRIETAAAPRDLGRDVLRPIEDQLGRVRTADKYAPRTIDLDVLLHGATVLDDSDCHVPAPEIRTRLFLVVCLLELDAGLVLPDTGERLAALLEGEAAREFEADEGLTARLRREVGLKG